MKKLKSQQKNTALEKISEALLIHQDEILAENAKDINEGKKNKLTQALIDRLTLSPARIQNMADCVKKIIAMQEPIGKVFEGWKQPNDLYIQKTSVPLGVIGIIYEARPNVTVDTIALCIKSSNCIILRGSSSAIHSNKALVKCIKSALLDTAVPQDAVQLITDTNRESLSELLTQRDSVDLLIPRGSQSLIQRVVNESTVPTLETGIGNCHIYIDESADLENAKKIAINAKVQRPSVCNACESILIHKNINPNFIQNLIQSLKTHGVEIRACATLCSLDNDIVPATENDWSTEFLDLVVSIKIVSSLDAAISHINRYGSKHSEAIISEDHNAIQRFTEEIDASTVLVNASTRFTDGEEFGFGAEMGISTQKLHARGPVGLDALCSIQYQVFGKGHTRN